MDMIRISNKGPGVSEVVFRLTTEPLSGYTGEMGTPHPFVVIGGISMAPFGRMEISLITTDEMEEEIEDRRFNVPKDWGLR